ncbi:DUF6958 family protein [Pontivivens insulae]|uniref:Uncharacterized protein n=1 Tax=Pontivivens insulae TaxID=1639689 RepID=A0A2R8AFN5_9RHOB|nr:hypothetical protein [Pontivivens insulae]RED12284.1 hypothetical protein DFR53_3002 [Pontivivens insulae]SPF31041.1 hypothetical protein POI8812_03391 [Pontivivens insulae]
MAEPRVACRTPAKGRDGVTNIPEWKFDAVRGAILAGLSQGPVLFKDLNAAVDARLTADQRRDLGSLGWHVTTVKLELEVRGEIVRVPGSGPQRIMLAADDVQTRSNPD